MGLKFLELAAGLLLLEVWLGFGFEFHLLGFLLFGKLNTLLLCLRVLLTVLDFHLVWFLLFDFLDNLELLIVLKLFPELDQQIATPLQFNRIVLGELHLFNVVLDGLDKI